MILVLTTETGDNSHSRFIDWLTYYDADFLILTGESIFKNEVDLKIDTSNNLILNGRNLSKEVSVVFNRRWLTTDKLPRISIDNKLNIGLRKTISSEIYELRQFLDYSLKNALWIPKIHRTNVNKLTILFKAIELGIKVPQFLVTNNKHELIQFIETHQRVITKAMGNFPRNYTDNNFLINPIYTKIIDNNLIDQLPEKFQLSIFQEQIIKTTEYRVLYFNQKCYPVELLSQENDFTKVDSRMTSDISEIRLLKSHLPLEIENKLINLMSSINLNIGCIDLLLTDNGEYYFLEVNPVGQIAGYSYRGNLNFEKDVVEYMINLDQNES